MNIQTVVAVVNSQKKGLVLIALIGFWFFFLWHAISADRTFAVFMDNESMLGPILASMSSAIRSGVWPLRMDTVLGGFPLYNLAQISPFYPLYLLILPIFTNPLDVMHSMHWITIGHLFILEINAYIFIRVAGASRLAALFGSALVAFSANSLSYSPWINITVPYSWFPLYLAGLIGLLQHPLTKRYFAMALVGMVLLAFASPSQPLIHAVLVTVIFMVVQWINNVRIGKAADTYYSFVSVGCVAILAILITAPVLFPALLEYKDMVRWVGKFKPVMGNDRIPFPAFLTDQLSIGDLGGVFLKFKSAAVGSQYTGVITVALACLAVISRPRSWLVLGLAFIAGYSLISATGSNLGLAYLNYYIPMLNKIREPSRFLVLFQFATGTLAALGIDELRNMVMQKDMANHVRMKLLVMAIPAVAAGITWLIIPERITSPLSPAIPVAILIALLILTWFISIQKFRCRGLTIATVWGGVALILLSVEVPWLPPTLTNSLYLSKGTLALDTALARVASLDPGRDYRIIFGGKTEKPLAGMIASYHGLRTLNSFICPAPRRYFEELYHHVTPPNNYFRVLGAKYLLCKECTDKDTRAYQFRESTAGYDIYESQDVLPRTYIKHRLDGNFSSLFDFQKQAATHKLSDKILYTEPKVNLGLNKNSDSAPSECRTREDKRTINHSRFVVQCKKGGVLVLNEFFDKAWRVRVDGVQKRVLKVNGNQLGARFAAGSHIVEFSFFPRVFNYSVVLMFIGLGLCLVLFKNSDIILDSVKKNLKLKTLS